MTFTLNYNISVINYNQRQCIIYCVSYKIYDSTDNRYRFSFNNNELQTKLSIYKNVLINVCTIDIVMLCLWYVQFKYKN